MSLNNLLLEGKEGWFTLRGWEGVFHVKLDTGICDFEEDIIIENKLKNTDTIIKYNNFIFLLPTGENDVIDIYNVEKKLYEYHIKLELNEKCYFDNAIIKENYIYLVNNWSTNPAIFVFSIHTFSIIKKISIDKKILWKSKCEGRPLSKDIVIDNDILILASSVANYIIKVNLCNYKIEYENIICNLKGFSTMCINGEDYWFTDENALVIKYNQQGIKEYDLKKIANLDIDLSIEELEYKNSSQGYRASYMYFNSTKSIGTNIFWIPGRTNKLLKFDICSEQWSTIYLRPELEGYTSWILYPNIQDGELYVYLLRELKLIKIDNSTEEINFNVLLKNKTIIAESDVLYEQNDILLRLNDFINNKFKMKKPNLVKKNETYGEYIWNTVKSKCFQVLN